MLEMLKGKYKNLNGKKKTQYLAIIIVVAVILAIYISSLVPAGNTQDLPEMKEDDLEARLTKVLSKVDGAGEVDVVINYESTGEKTAAYSSNSQNSVGKDGAESSSESNSMVTTQKQGDTNPVILEEKTPKVRGVVVVSQGASDISVKMDLLNAVVTLLNVSPDKVEVLKMQSK